MTHFIDGPAEGKSVMIKRVPIYLRVVIDRAGRVDALNEKGDKPGSDERVYVYVMKAYGGNCHILIRGKGGSGFYPICYYEVFDKENPEAGPALHDEKAWEAWVDSQPRREVIGIDNDYERKS